MPDESSERPFYTLFDTAIGRCGIAWSARGLTRMQLPESDAAATQARLQRVADPAAGPLPAPILDAVAALQRYFEGAAVDFRTLPLDLSAASPFHRRLYVTLRDVGWGETVSYGELARRVGDPGAARAVGQAMGRNPLPVIIPCHRVLAAERRIGGFSAYGSTTTKERLLALEGVRPGPELPLIDLIQRTRRA